MKKKILALIMCAVMVIAALPVYAFAAESGDWRYNVLSETDKTAEITGYTGSDIKITIPREINGYTITRIGNSAFAGNETLFQVRFYDNIKEIGSYAFYRCTKLDDFGNHYGTLPESVTDIGDYAFAYAKASNIHFGNHVTHVGFNAIEGTGYYNYNSNWYKGVLYVYDGLGGNVIMAVRESEYEEEAITNRNFVGTVADGAFPEGSVATFNKAMRHIGVGNQFATIKGYANTEAQRYANSIGCNFVQLEEYPDWTYNVLSEDDKTAELTGYLGEEKEITLPTEVDGYTMVAVADYAFNRRQIHRAPFKGYLDIESITIPETYKKIGEYAIYEMYDLLYLDLPDSLEYVGWYALQKCGYVDRIFWDEIRANNEPEIYYIDGCCFFAPQNEEMPKVYMVKPGTKIISSAAFMYTSDIQQVIFPEGVEHITEGAFCGCKALRSAVIPNSVKELQKWTFCASDNRFDAIYISPGVTKIDENFVMRDMDINMNYTNELSDFLTIYGEEGSYAEQFANEHGITFIASKDIIRGDMDGDGTVSLVDYSTAKTAVANEDFRLDGNAEIVGDMNADQVIDAFDMFEIDRTVNA
jgi:hypothetical protein